MTFVPFINIYLNIFDSYSMSYNILSNYIEYITILIPI